MEIKNENLKKLRLGFCYQKAYEEAFKKYPLDKILRELEKKLYGINTDSEEATKKKI